MPFLQMYGKELVSFLAPFIAWCLTRFFRAKAKLILSSPHRFTFLIPEPRFDDKGTEVAPNQTARTASYQVKNVGSDPARKVELVFNWKPAYINIWPARHIVEHTEADNRYVVILENLAPDEYVGFELLAVNGELPALITARCEQCTAKFVDMSPQPIVRPWMARAAGLLIIVGAGATLYVLLLILQFLVVGTPYGHSA